MRNLIIGGGEVGKAVYNIIKKAEPDTFIKDIEPLSIDNIFILHICIPYSDNFVSIVNKYIEQYQPEYTIIHSTVKIGTSDLCNAYYSPIRGVHPNLEDGIRTFVKYLAPINEELRVYLVGLGLNARCVEKRKTLEFSKLMSTTRYGMEIAFEKMMKEECDKLEIDYDIAYRDWTETYNYGYKKLGMENVVRPILNHVDGPIGGHCVQSNAAILFEDNIMKDLCRLILSRGQALPSDDERLKSKIWLFCQFHGLKRGVDIIAGEFGFKPSDVIEALFNSNIIKDRRR